MPTYAYSGQITGSEADRTLKWNQVANAVYDPVSDKYYSQWKDGESYYEIPKGELNADFGDSKVFASGTPLYKPVQYKTGGLADFTGPAWLDGTKSRPELVLNQQDTANFIELKDILAEILAGTTIARAKGNEKGGDNYYDIEISVENISEDYDVEQLAEKIKTMIYEDSVYRNVNTINLIR